MQDGYVALLADVTAQRALERDREQTNLHRTEVLERQAQFEQQLIGIVSHDLRNPLNVIHMASTVLAGGEHLSEDGAKNVVRIQNATQRATRLVSDLLDFTQARLGGGIRLQRKSSDFRSAVTTAIQEIEITFPSRQIELRMSGDLEGDWDLDRLAQVVLNLVTNALKYGPATTSIQVAAYAETAEGEVILTVHNEGATIRVEQLGSLHPF